MATIANKNRISNDGQNFTIRSALPRDAAQIRSFDIHSLETTPELGVSANEVTWPSEEKYCLLIQDYLDQPGDLMIVIESNQDIIGKLEFKCGRRDRNKHAGYFDMVVEKSFRGQGLGEALLTELIGWAKSSSVEVIKLDVREQNLAAVALYKKMGFVEFGRDPYATKMDGIYDTDLMMLLKL